MKENLITAIDELISRANELNAIAESKEKTPIESGRAAWERKGILHSIKTIVEKTGLGDFEDLFESK